MKKIYKIFYHLAVIFLIATVFSCTKEETGIIEYKAEPKTPLGSKLVNNTDLIATIFKDSTYTVTDGLQTTELHYFSMKGYSIHIFIFEVDLSKPTISIEVSTPNNSDKNAMQRMTIQATFEDAPGHLVRGGVNGSFFNTSTGETLGLLYKNASMIKTYTSSNPNYFVVTKDKKAIITDGTEYESLKSNIQEGVGGGVMLVKNNVIVNQTDVTVQPRTCIGISADKQKVYIFAVDGRNYYYSNGMSYDELAKCMIALGAQNALNLDGGGSTTFFVRNTTDFTPGRFVIRNFPSDYGGAEREVANGLLIISK